MGLETSSSRDAPKEDVGDAHDDQLGRTSLSGGLRRGPLPKPLLRRFTQMRECYSYVKNTGMGSDFDDSITSVHVVIFNVKAIKSKLWTMETFAKVSMCCRSCHRRGCGVFSHAPMSSLFVFLSLCFCVVPRGVVLTSILTMWFDVAFA